ncbi:sarcosine oxidase subunit gamma [Paenirhodobacter enshiensis]|uniref:sarcosine oxidase subunit gamma n=1 Tax=Paenirhodobacter enshiensis TaxID=1105367 RepID=UPI003FA2636E
MSELTALTALGATEPRIEHHGAVSLRENAGLALASVAVLGRDGAQPLPFGLRLPEPGHWVAGQGVSAFWTGPGQWMIEAEGRAEEDFARDVKAHAPGCAVSEQTDGWVAIEIASTEGAAPIEALLERLVNVDLGAFGPGSATRTGLEHMSVFVIRRAADRVAILGMRSSAGSLWHAISVAASRLQVPA